MGLRKVYPNQSLADVIWYYLVYLEARLLNDEHSKELAPKITVLIDEVESTWRGQRARWRAEISAQALVDKVNYQLDRQTKQFSRILLSQGDIGMNTDHPRYKRYFRVALSRIVRLALEPQMKMMRPWLDSIKTESELVVQSFYGILSDVLAQGDEALRHREKASAARKDYRVREVNQLIKWINDTCQEIYGTLRAKAPSLNRPYDWADGFFYSPRNASTPEATELYQESIYNICKARGLDISDAASERLDNTKEVMVLQDWLARLLHASSVEEVLGLPAPTEEEEA